MKIVKPPYGGAGKAVFVHSYSRFRHGRYEWVIHHHRRWPRA